MCYVLFSFCRKTAGQKKCDSKLQAYPNNIKKKTEHFTVGGNANRRYGCTYIVPNIDKKLISFTYTGLYNYIL